jgi:hypothetical protein
MIRSRVINGSRIRAPIAWVTALPIAATVGAPVASPRQRLHRAVPRRRRTHPTRPSPMPDKRALLAGNDQCRGNRMSVNRLPPVGRIRAVHLPEGGPRVPKSLTIEYSDRSNASKWYQLEVPFVDAMHLLALLQGAKDDVGYKEPVEAPAPEKD